MTFTNCLISFAAMCTVLDSNRVLSSKYAKEVVYMLVCPPEKNKEHIKFLQFCKNIFECVAANQSFAPLFSKI